MLNIRKIFIPLLIATGIVACNSTLFNLTEYNYKSASVLPTFMHRNVKYAILSREAFGISKKHTYDDFSGGRDAGEMDPTLSAAREFHEEGALEEALGWSLSETKNFIDLNKENTHVVVAYSKDKNICTPQSRDIRNVTYITNFSAYSTELFDNFYDALAREEARYDALGTPGKHRVTTEKDRIAKVKWNDLKRAIIKQKDTSNPIYVRASVMDPQTRRFRKERITLRPFLAMKLRSFFLDQPYEQSENDKIRFYHD